MKSSDWSPFAVPGVILLAGLFIYDIFWVFCTPVMVSVARSFEAPIKLLFLRAGDDGPSPFRCHPSLPFPPGHALCEVCGVRHMCAARSAVRGFHQASANCFGQVADQALRTMTYELI